MKKLIIAAVLMALASCAKEKKDRTLVMLGSPGYAMIRTEITGRSPSTRIEGIAPGIKKEMILSGDRGYRLYVYDVDSANFTLQVWVDDKLTYTGRGKSFEFTP